MAIKQLSVFVENRIGRLTSLTKALADANIDFRAAVIAETTDFGILRCIVEEPEAAALVLNHSGFNASLTEVTAVYIPDRPGGVHGILELLSAAEIDVKYLYSANTKVDGKAIIIFKSSNTEDAEKLLTENGVKLATLKDLA